jgi:hypothetical protein
MSRWQSRIARIKTDISITDILSGYGYDVRSDAGDREQQFPCDLHGDGSDNKPSGRVYPTSASWYCFACDKTRDAIETVREKENLDFKGALAFLEKKYGLPALPWEDDDEVRAKPRPGVANELDLLFKREVPFATRLQTTYAIIKQFTVDKELPMDQILAWWEAADGVAWLVAQNQCTESKGQEALQKILDKIREAQHGEPA